MTTINETEVRLIASSRNWIEGEAVRQLYAAAELGSMRQAVGLPDLHPGNGSPVGAAFVSEDMIYPHLIGTDIGCGMAWFETDLLRRKAKLDRWTERLRDLEHPWEGNVLPWLHRESLPSSEFDPALGTIGGGNHFAELQAIDKVMARGEFEALGLNADNLFVLVHSGSRGLGEETAFRAHAQMHGADGISADEAESYLVAHDEALRWAKTNRALIAYRFAEALNTTASLAWDACHNSISRREGVWVHRKGATPTDAGIAVIPGSRGTSSYLVRIASDSAASAWSVAHGAGRKWSRSESRARMRERYHHSELTQTGLGGRVICENRDLLYEEAPEAYKKIEVVVQDLVDAGLVSVIATLRPLITYKTRAIRR